MDQKETMSKLWQVGPSDNMVLRCSVGRVVVQSVAGWAHDPLVRRSRQFAAQNNHSFPLAEQKAGKS